MIIFNKNFRNCNLFAIKKLTNEIKKNLNFFKFNFKLKEHIKKILK